MDNQSQHLGAVPTESPRPALEQGLITIPDINELPCHPILQTMVSRDTWVKVGFFRDKPVEKAELFRTIELLCMMHNGWT